MFNNAVPLACIIGATVLLATGVSGWGWLLFIAVITYVY